MIIVDRLFIGENKDLEEVVMKAVIKYPGSKWSLAKWIISMFPEHHRDRKSVV